MADAKNNEAVNSSMASQLQADEVQEVGWSNLIDAEEVDGLSE